MNSVTQPTSAEALNATWTTSGATARRRDEPLAWWTVYGTSGFSTVADDMQSGFFLFLPGTSPGSFGRSEHSLIQSAVAEIRRRSQLTWEQLARVFGVRRRSLHFWARGARPSAENAERILRVLMIVRQLDTGEPERTRTELLRPRRDGLSIYDVLSAGRDHDVLGLVRGTTLSSSTGPVTKQRRRPPALDSSERERRRGFPPVELLDGRHDETPSLGRVLGAVRIPGGTV